MPNSDFDHELAHTNQITGLREEVRGGISVAAASIEAALHAIDQLCSDGVYDVEYAEGGRDVRDLRCFLDDARRLLGAARALNSTFPGADYQHESDNRP